MPEPVPISIPKEFKATMIKMFGLDGEKWLARLPDLVSRFLQEWQLQVDTSFEVSLSFNFVVPVRQADGRAAILKLGPHPKGRFREAQMLEIYGGRGAAQLIKANHQEGVLLIERLQPGKDLRSLWLTGELSDRATTEIAARNIKVLLPANLSQIEFPSVSIWGLGFEKFLRENRRGTLFPQDKVLKADLIFKNLVASTKTVIPLHGDLHHANILQSGALWRAIDPKGVIGDPAYEVGALMRNPMPELAKHSDLENLLEERLRVLGSILGFEVDRIWGWAYSQVVLAAIWAVEEGDESWRQWLVVANALEKAERAISEKA